MLVKYGTTKTVQESMLWGAKAGVQVYCLMRQEINRVAREAVGLPPATRLACCCAWQPDTLCLIQYCSMTNDERKHHPVRVAPVPREEWSDEAVAAMSILPPVMQPGPDQTINSLSVFAHNPELAGRSSRSRSTCGSARH